MSQQQKPIEAVSFKDSFNIGYAILKCQATCVTPFLHTRFGAEALGMPAAGAFVAFCFWVVATESPELLVVAFFWLMALLAQRGRMLVDAWRGHFEYSGYGGFPVFTWWLCRNETLARVMEGALVLAAGAFVEDMCWPVGHFLMASGVSILFLESIHHHYHRKVEQGRRDGLIEMQGWAHPLTGKAQRWAGRR